MLVRPDGAHKGRHPIPIRVDCSQMAWTRRALGLLVGAAVVGACTFPSPSYRSGDGDGGGAGDAPFENPGDGAGGSSSGADGAGSSGDAPGGDGSGSGSGAGDGGGSGGGDALPGDAPAGDVAPVCDVDKDTYKAKGGTCGGTDCCDTDAKANPGQQGYFPTPDACGSFDYDCSGKAEPEYKSNIACGGTGLTGCTGGPGFVGADPGCGNSAVYGVCVGNGALACAPGQFTNVQQACH
jgi:hypothetical protein